MKLDPVSSFKNINLPQFNLPYPVNLTRLRDIKAARYAYSVYKYGVFFPLFGLGTSLLALIFIPLSFVVNEKTIQLGGILWSRYCSMITPMFVKTRGIENIEPGRSYIVVANHQSQYDIFVMYGWLPVNFRWVMKMELRKVPIIGYFCERAGHVFIDRSNSSAAVESINRAKERIRDGISILFFPEGTRSSDGDMLPFKKGAFKFALDMGLPLLPVSIINTGNILPSNTIDLFPGEAEMVVHKPVEIDGYSEENIYALMGMVRDIIKKGMEEPAA